MMIQLFYPFSGNYPITQHFGENPQVYAPFGMPGHDGIDFGLPAGTPVLAAADGAIATVGVDAKGYGLNVRIQHIGFLSLYGHLSLAVVTAKQLIKAGDLIGYSGGLPGNPNSGFSTGAHLHLEIRIPGQGAPGYKTGALDPEPFLTQQNVPEPPIRDGYGIVMIDRLNIRMEASINSRDVGDLTKFDQAEIAGDLIKDGGYTWVPIKLWVASEVDGQVFFKVKPKT
jgi:hypothetical protein